MRHGREDVLRRPSWRVRLRDLLASRSFPFVAAAVTIVLTLPSLRVGWIIDDHFHRLVMVGSGRFREGLPDRLDMFRFLTGDRAENYKLMDSGFLPWWADLDIHGAFWRPISAITHWVDYELWPETPALMHVQSMLWWAAAVVLAGVFFRRIIGATWVAGLATLLYAIDDARGIPVGFLANRNAIIATVFGLLTLVLHDRVRREGRVALAPVAWLAFLASLLSSEGGLATTAYLFAFAVFIDSGARRLRALSLVPYAVIVVGWRIVWSAMGYGVSTGMGLYVDPLTEPLVYLLAALERIPMLLLGQFGLPPSDVSLILDARGLLIYAVVAAAVLAAGALIAVPVWRRQRDTGFWATCVLLALLPISATFPNDRLLIFVSVGAAALIARFIEGWGRIRRARGALRASGYAANVGGAQPKTSHDAPPSAEGGIAAGPLWPSNMRRKPVTVLAWLLVFVHLIVAPIGLVVRSFYPAGTPGMYERLMVQTEFDESIADKTLVIVNAPMVFYTMHMIIRRDLEGEPAPLRVRSLTSGMPSITVYRPDARSLVVRPDPGFYYWIFDRLFRSPLRPMHVGERVELTGMTVEVTELTADHRPAEARFTFDVPLEDPSLCFLHWVRGDFLWWTPPPVGTTVELSCNWSVSPTADRELQ